jgi:uncharacterized membrane protein
MKSLFANIRSVAVAGFLFLLPVYVLLVIITKAWASLSSVGTSLAKVFGLQSMLGVGGSTAVSGVLLILIWIACGLLVRLSFVDALNKGIERLLIKYIPGYSTYKAIAEDKLHQRTRTLPYASVLVRGDLGWQPAYLIEQDVDGHCVLFVPRAPDTSAGSVLLVSREQLRFLPAIPANELDASLKKMGKGLLEMARERAGAAGSTRPTMK